MTRNDTNIDVIKGESLSLQFGFRQDGTAVNLLGASLKGEIRVAKDDTLAETFSMTVTSAAEGLITVSLSKEETAALDRTVKYVYDLFITYASGTRHCFAKGLFNVHKNVTEF